MVRSRILYYASDQNAATCETLYDIGLQVYMTENVSFAQIASTARAMQEFQISFGLSPIVEVS